MSPAAASEGWFGMLLESCCFGMRKADFFGLGGYDERFQSPGGGLVNPDFFRRALLRPELQYVVLLGEGTFHQFHGGVASNQPRDRQPWAQFHEEYLRIRGEPFKRVARAPMFIGSIPAEARHVAKYSAARGLELWENPAA